MSIERILFNFIWKKKEPNTAKAIWNNERTSGCITIHDFKLYYRVTVIKTVQFWNKNKQEIQWKLIKDTEINPHTYGYLIFNKESRIIQ